MNATNRKKSAEEIGQTARFRRLFRRPCVGIVKLMEWEMAQYRKAVDEHRLRLSLLEDRDVDWSEAEKSFCEYLCEDHSLKWRDEYCGTICEHRATCPIAAFYHPAA